MTVPHSGNLIVRLPVGHSKSPTFGAFNLNAPNALVGGASYATEALFSSSHSAGFAFGLHLPPEERTEWVLHRPAVYSPKHPWDIAHDHARALAAGSLSASDVYVEPDLLHERSFDLDYEKATEPQNTTSTQPTKGLSKHFPPDSKAKFSPCWHLESGFGDFLGARQKYQCSGRGIRVAHLDTGYWPKHISTPRNIRPEEGYNYHEDNTNTTDLGSGLIKNKGHGTGTLGLLAGNTVKLAFDKGPVFQGDLGGAPDAEVIPVRIGASVVHLYSKSMARGLDHALSPKGGKPCDVVTVSHGGLPTKAWAEAVNRLYEAGIVVVAASGDSIQAKVMNLATHYTVYPSAFYRVVTATGVTFNRKPYKTRDFGVMQGSWGPRKVMKKALAAFTPNVPWMRIETDAGWDMDGGGTSASTPQIAAACALWLEKYGSGLPRDWRRVAACRRALFQSVSDRNKNLDEIGVGVLNVSAMLDPDLAATILKDFEKDKLKPIEPDTVSWPFFRLLFGRPPEGKGIDEMYEVEAAQLLYRTKNILLTKAVLADPTGTKLKGATAKKLRAEFIAEPLMSNTLRGFLQSQLSK